MLGKLRRQLTPIGFSSPCSWSLSLTVSASTPASEASMPAGAFHTPRLASVLAITPAIAPDGVKVSIWPFRNGSRRRMRGKYRAAWLALVRLMIGVFCWVCVTIWAAVSGLASQPSGGSMIKGPPVEAEFSRLFPDGRVGRAVSHVRRD